MVEWQEIKAPCFVIAIGFLFVATSLILLKLDESEDVVLITLGIGFALILPTTLALRMWLQNTWISEMRRKEI
jgi:uncharacterized membrane protein